MTVEEAVERVNQGHSLEDCVLDKDSAARVNVRDAMILNSGGIVIPEENLFYNDDDIEHDEEIDSLVVGQEITGLSWSQKAKRAAEFETKTDLLPIDLATAEPEIDNWIKLNREKLSTLLKPIVINLFHAEQAIGEKSL
ncbi:hypothetical protein CEQ90_00165 [Lewinellaceae bacterium SD302]|nr:hypothetical protein CEQ90_00165 [Lewinellaceae bacterium SD302]